MKSLKLTLWFLYHTAVLLGIWAVLGAAEEKADRVIVSLLVIAVLYLAHQTRTSGLAMAHTELAAFTRHLEIRTVLGKPPDEADLRTRDDLKKATEPTGATLMAMIFSSIATLSALVWGLAAAFE